MLTVVVTVVSDLAAGEGALHAVTLGLVTAAVAMLRVHLAGRDRGLLQFLSGCIVAQPALHAAANLVPHGPLDHGAGNQVGTADLAVTGTQLTVAVVVVVAVSFAQQLVTMLCTVIRTCWIRIVLCVPHAGPGVASGRRTPVRALLSSRYRPIAMRKRGPPRAYTLAG